VDASSVDTFSRSESRAHNFSSMSSRCFRIVVSTSLVMPLEPVPEARLMLAEADLNS
jgi:hypothetical protein